MNRILISSAAGVLLAAAAAAPAFAQVPTTASVNAGTIMRVNAPGASAGTMVHANASVSIDDRITALQNLLARIQTSSMSSAASAKVTAAIEAQIKKLEDLKASGQTTLTTGTPGASNGGSGVASSGHVTVAGYLTVMSKAAVTAAANHLLAVADQLSGLAAKLDARIGEAGSADTDSLRATLSDMNAKIADAKVQANAALTIVANLSDDADASADTTVRGQLTKAASDLKVARSDIAAAYKDAQTIVVAIRGKGPAASASTQATVNTSANAQ
ncbi:MAG TPA: hypothetical protein VHC20_07270 [Candidatus Paceibacterota bacterium]|nr:hypothetical protein [Candidatus Paceibacterota bacterium]